MKNKYFLLSFGAIAMAIVLGAAGIKPVVSTAAAEPMARKIVVFNKDLSDFNKDRAIERIGAEKIRHLKAAKSSVALLSKKAEQELAKNPDVLRIDDDVEVFALAKPIKIDAVRPQPAQVLPWGIDRIDADLIWGTNTGDPVKVGVIDTGIDVKHPDLTGNLKGGASMVWYTSSYNDDNGHGTHVAGIIGALDNTIGVVGVGPQIDLYAVKVLDRNGSGYLSDVIEGLDWAIANRMQVVNMSLGTSSNVPSFYEAVQRVYNAGITQVAAAGNNGGAVIYPAAYSEVIAVSATDKTDNLASWSSRGPEVDLAAPGVSIYSTYKGQTYATLSGTSMAAPHVAGAAALVLTVPTKCDIDGNGRCSPSEVQQRLQNTAEWLSGLNSDQQGAGLVDAEKAVIQ